MSRSAERLTLVIAVIGLVLAIALTAWTFFPSKSRTRQFESGAELAKILIQRAAENNGVAALSGLGGRVCVGPGAAAGDYYPSRLFHPFAITYRETDESSGVWYVYIGVDATRTVEIYGIPKQILLWNYPTSTVPVSELVSCPSQMTISKDGGTVSLASGPKRVPAVTSMK